MLNVLYYPDKNFNLQTHCTLFLNLNYEKNFTMNFAVCEHFLMNKTKKKSQLGLKIKKMEGKIIPKIKKLETDYLVIGSGAMGMAFVDEMLFGSSKYGNNQNTEFIIIDKHAKPGGHWNDAYQFVTLHQPAAYYGVNSKILGDGMN